VPERTVLDLFESSCHCVSTENKERKAKRPAGNIWQGKIRLTMIPYIYIYVYNLPQGLKVLVETFLL